MTTTTWSAVQQSTTDAEFRAWGSAISTALSTIGLVQTTDTGQINWTTVTKPASSYTNQGYEIWRMNDTAQSTCPIYLRLDYGSGGSAATPAITMTVGTGSNGSGTINGVTILTATQLTYSSSGYSPITAPGAACAVDGAFWLSWGYSASYVGFTLGFSRLCDNSGNISTNGGLAFGGCYSLSTKYFQTYIKSTATVRTSARPIPMPTYSGQTAWTTGTDQSVFPGVLWTDHPEPVYGMLGIGNTDFSVGSAFSCTVWGASHTFLPLSGTLAGVLSAVDYGLSNYSRLALIWE